MPRRACSSVIATGWQASANTVALTTGVLSGVISALGCVWGGTLCDRMDRKLAYCLFGLLQAGCALAMGLAPATEWNFILFTSLYSFITGLTYAAFSAVVLEAIGQGAAATKYSLLASLANMPIAWMTVANGWTLAHWGGPQMLMGEAAMCGAAVLGFLLLLRWLPRAKAVKA